MLRRLGPGIASLERALAICHDLSLLFYVHYVAPPLALAHAFSGRAAETVDLLEQTVGQDVAMGIMCHHALTLTTLGEVYLVAGRPRDARASAERALQLSRERDEARRPTSCPDRKLTALGRTFRADPYPVLARLRAQEPF